MSLTQPKKPWLVRMHHRMRTVSFAMVFSATCLHLAGKNFATGTWVFLVFLLLIYPHLQYWRSLRAADSIRAEMYNLQLDSVLLGIFVATIHFSDWLTFSVVMGTLSNNAANKGWRGIGEALLGLLAGIVVGIAVAGFTFSAHTDWPAMLVCMVGLGAYLLAMNNIGFSRNNQLRTVRKQLENRETELLGANETMRKNLAEIDQLQSQLREQANRDALTHLFNRRFLDTSLNRELARCAREGRPLSLLMLDVDHFKKYNDHYGHQAGDECLKRVAQILNTSAKRASDLAARYGGEEFVLVLADTDAPTAMRLAEEVLLGIASLNMPHEMSRIGRVSVSIGSATSTQEAYRDVDSLLRAADQALYRAKHSGRNQQQMAPASPVQIGLGNLAAVDAVRLVWKMDYECGHPEIDEAHRELFEQANLLLTSALGGASDSVPMVTKMAETLIAQLERHFQEEEQIICAAGFPEAAKHAAAHRELIEQANRLVGRLGAKELDLAEFFRFLGHNVVVRHMLEMDRTFMPYLLAH